MSLETLTFSTDIERAYSSLSNMAKGASKKAAAKVPRSRWVQKAAFVMRQKAESSRKQQQQEAAESSSNKNAALLRQLARRQQKAAATVMQSRIRPYIDGDKSEYHFDSLTLPDDYMSRGGVYTTPLLDSVVLPRRLTRLVFGWDFNQPIDTVIWPKHLQTLQFRGCFNQSLDNVTFPSTLMRLTFGYHFNQSMDNVSLPSGLYKLTFGALFNQSMDNVTLPSGLRQLTFGACFNQNLDNVVGLRFLQDLVVGRDFNQLILPESRDSTVLPALPGSKCNLRIMRCDSHQMSSPRCIPCGQFFDTASQDDIDAFDQAMESCLHE